MVHKPLPTPGEFDSGRPRDDWDDVIASLDVEKRDAFLEKLNNLQGLHGMELIDYAISERLTTKEWEELHWRRGRIIDDSGSPQMPGEWDYGSARHEQWIDENRRPHLLAALRRSATKPTTIDGMQRGNLSVLRKLYDKRNWPKK